MSFILDALRKSEHERQRSTVPGLSQVPLATPRAEIPRWMFAVVGVLAVAVLALGGAWWRSTQATTPAAQSAMPPLVERRVDLPPATPSATPVPTAASTSTPGGTVAPVPQPTPTTPPLAAASESLRAAATTASEPTSTLENAAAAASPAPPVDEPALPSAAALATEGITVPPLRLELHAYSERPRDRFVFINGRRYVEGERLPEGPELVTIEPRGAVLSYLGRHFLLVPE